MAKFYGSLEGERKTKATKPAEKFMAGHIRSWDHGVWVEYVATSKHGAVCEVWTTGGSNDPTKKKCIKRFELKEVSNKRPGYEGRGGIGNRVRE